MEDNTKKWWWFDPKNKQHIHEFSASWEILRRTDAYRQIYDRMRVVSGTIDKNSPVCILQTGAAMISFRNMLPQSPPVPSELREMVERWQNMIVNGWTPDKNYLETSQHSRTARLPSGQTIHIPPTYGFNNRGIPVILPRQISSKGHTALFVELCDIKVAPSKTPRIVHIEGSCSPSLALQELEDYGKPITLAKSGKFIAIEFPLHHPVQALKALLKSGLDSITNLETQKKPSDDIGKIEGEENERGEYSRGVELVVGTLAPLRAIAFFQADKQRHVIARGFSTLIRPERIERHLPKLREVWIEWDSAERARFFPQKLRTIIENESRVAWETEERNGRLAHQSTCRPIRPKEDLDNLACADCAPFYQRQHSLLLNALPDNLRTDSDFNKRIDTGCRLIRSVDDLFLPLLNCSPKSSI